jgi:hypothetical protein
MNAKGQMTERDKDTRISELGARNNEWYSWDNIVENGWWEDMHYGTVLEWLSSHERSISQETD